MLDDDESEDLADDYDAEGHAEGSKSANRFDDSSEEDEDDDDEAAAREVCFLGKLPALTQVLIGILYRFERVSLSTRTRMKTSKPSAGSGRNGDGRSANEKRSIWMKRIWS